MRQVIEDSVLSGTYSCIRIGNDLFQVALTSFGTAWEVLALCLAVWIATKHFREQSRWTIEDFFAVLMKSHVLYFAS